MLALALGICLAGCGSGAPLSVLGTKTEAEEESDDYSLEIPEAVADLSEEELVKKNIDEMWEINRIFGDDEGAELRTAVLAGEEHPVSCQISETDRGDRLSVDFYIPKGAFEYIVFIYLTDAELEDLTKLFEKI